MGTHRWNIEEYGNGIRICRGLHDKSVNCEWEYYVPPNDPLIEELAEKIADHYYKDELLKEMAEALEGLLKLRKYDLSDPNVEIDVKAMQKYHEQENK